MKNKILILIDCFTNLQSGPPRQIYELIRGLNKERFQLIVVSLECGSDTPEDVSNILGCRFIRLPVKRIYSLEGFSQGFAFRRLLREERIDILMTYHFSSDIWGAFWGYCAGVKAIISNRRDIGFWRKKHQILAYKIINRFVRKIVVVANSIKEMVVKEERYPTERIDVIYSGVALAAQEDPLECGLVRKELGIQGNEIVVMCVANFNRIKGHQYLLRAFAKTLISLGRDDIKLVLVGDGELKDELLILSKSLNLVATDGSDRVLFLGRRSDVRRILKIADLCVLPSLSEGMSNSILEYMAEGKPVIATRVGGNSELIMDGETGVLVEPANIDQLADALSDLIKSPALCTQMGGEGKKRVSCNFSIERMVSQYEEMFESAGYSQGAN